MVEWILIITLHKLNEPGKIAAYDVEIIDGFRTEYSCLSTAD